MENERAVLAGLLNDLHSEANNSKRSVAHSRRKHVQSLAVSEAIKRLDDKPVTGNESPMSNDLHVYHNEATDWIVASSPQEAMVYYRQYLKDAGCTLDEDEITEFVQCDDDRVLKIIPDEDQSLPPIEKTCAAWAAHNGKGFLCSENF